jgi:protein-tyrosine phosphatase
MRAGTSKTKILFVCLGNICRSPTAEAIFISKSKAAGVSDRFEVDSAGLLSVHEGEPADGRIRKHASARGYTLESRSRPINASDFDHYDYIIGMDNQNLRDLKQRMPHASTEKKLSLMLSYAAEPQVTEVPDPYYGGAQGFEEVIDLVESASDGLLKQLLHEC